MTLQPRYSAALLVAGTAIGAGMLALPVSTAQLGFFPSVIWLVVTWYTMYLAALLLLEVALYFPRGTNMISMASACFGSWGRYLAWTVYLLLLYVLNAAYLSALTTLCTPFLLTVIPAWTVPLGLVGLLAGCLYTGVRFLDGCNRVLMLGMWCSFLAIVLSFSGATTQSVWAYSSWHGSIMALPVIVTAFGFHIIIPSLRTHIADDVNIIRSALWWGSIMPLFIYVLWQFLVFATLPSGGESSLLALWQTGDVSALIQLLGSTLHNPYFTYYIDMFSVFIIMTSFLGVSLSLVDCLADGLSEIPYANTRIVSILCAFIPPLGLVLSHQQGFFIILRYAGVLVVLLLCCLPAAMALQCRKQGSKTHWVSFWSIVWVVIFSIVVMVCEWLH